MGRIPPPTIPSDGATNGEKISHGDFHDSVRARGPVLRLSSLVRTLAREEQPTQGAVSSDDSYVIGPGDVLAIDV